MNVSKDRLNGYKQALFNKDIKIDDKLIIEMDNFSEENGYTAAKHILKNNNVSAFVTTDDLIAFGVQRAVEELKYDDISIVGFNNIPLTQYKNPQIASVDINSEKLGIYAIKLLIDKLENRKNNGYYVIETRLIERESLIKNNIKI